MVVMWAQSSRRFNSNLEYHFVGDGAQPVFFD
jgi:hypothetical protein